MAKIEESGLDAEGGYLIVVNDVVRGRTRTRAPEIIDFLFRKRVWVFADPAPYVNRFRKGDRLVFYLAGRYGEFVGEARVASEVLPLEATLKEEVHGLGLTWFTRYVLISNIHRLTPPRRIRDLVRKLNFIADKGNFGLSLRIGIRHLGADDTKRILK